MDDQEDNWADADTQDDFIEESPKRLKLGSKKDSATTTFVKAHFDFTSESKSCKHCSKVYSLASSSTTVLDHLKNKHKICPAKSGTSKSKQVKITSVFTPPLNSRRVEELTKSVAKFLAYDMRPISTVSGKGFQAMINSFEPKYDLPDRTTFSRKWIPSLYQEKVEEIKTELASCLYEKSITTDLWTDNYRRRSYVTVTVHFVHDWQLKSYVLETKEFDGKKSAENLKNYLENVASTWTLGKPTVVSDNGSNIVGAVKLLGWRGVRCFAHTLNLCVSDGIKHCSVIQILLDKLRKIVTYFRYRTKQIEDKQKEILSALVNDGDLPDFDEDDDIRISSKTLKRDVVTRWNSILAMVRSVTECHSVIKALLFEDQLFDLILTTVELELADALIVFLKNFEVATEILSAEKYPSLSLYVPAIIKLQISCASDYKPSVNWYCQVKQSIESPNAPKFMKFVWERIKAIKTTEKEDDPLKKLKFLIGASIELRFLPFSDTHLLATLLDKRFQSLCSSAKFPVHPKDLLMKYYTLEINSGTVETVSEKTPAQELPGKFASFFSDFVDTSSTLFQDTRESKMEREISAFLKPICFSGSMDSFDVLQFWKTDGQQYKTLSVIAGTVLAISATSVPSERVFSHSGYILNQTRTNLDPANVDKLVFLHYNQ